MAEFDPHEECALLYALGELPDEKAREFETRMEESEQLTRTVRELEEGAVALAMASPRQRIPRSAWRNIERAVEEEKSVFIKWPWFKDKGWAAAAACLIGWLMFALMRTPQTIEHSAVDQNADHSATHTSTPAMADLVSESLGSNSAVKLDAKHEMDTSLLQLESEILRSEVSELQKRIDLISHSLTQQQAMLNDPSRLKFLRLGPATGTFSTNGISQELQRALAIAMARELGWLGNSNQFLDPRASEWASGMTNIGGIDFVDFRAGITNAGPSAQAQSAPEFAAPANTTPPPTAQDQPLPSGLLPAFASSDHVSVALDNTTAPAGSQVTLLAGATTDNQQIIGTLTMSGNPTVVTFQPGGFGGNTATLFGAGGLENLLITVNTITPAGGSNQLLLITIPTP